jgi:hypothetical protein
MVASLRKKEGRCWYPCWGSIGKAGLEAVECRTMGSSDLISFGFAVDPAPRGVDAVGCRIILFRDRTSMFESADITSYESATDTHNIRYSDGEQQIPYVCLLVLLHALVWCSYLHWYWYSYLHL